MQLEAVEEEIEFSQIEKPSETQPGGREEGAAEGPWGVTEPPRAPRRQGSGHHWMGAEWRSEVESGGLEVTGEMWDWMFGILRGQQGYCASPAWSLGQNLHLIAATGPLADPRADPMVWSQNPER